MNNHKLNAKKRTLIGKGNTKKVRRDGFIPAALYQKHQDSLSIKLSRQDFEKEFHGKGQGSSVSLNIDGDQKLAIIKHIDRHPLLGYPIHIEFQELRAGEKVTVEIPIYIANKSEVESHELVVQQLADMITIETLPKYLVDHVTLDANELKEDIPYHFEDLPIFKDENYKIHNPEDGVIAQLTHQQMVSEEEDEQEEELLAVEVPLVEDEE